MKPIQQWAKKQIDPAKQDASTAAVQRAFDLESKASKEKTSAAFEAAAKAYEAAAKAAADAGLKSSATERRENAARLRARTNGQSEPRFPDRETA